MPAKRKPKTPFPQPAAVLPGEADILANVIANLADHDAKLVYADWLEERDDPRGPLLRKFVMAYRAGKKLPSTQAAPLAWSDLVGITLIETLREVEGCHGVELGEWEGEILALARPAISYATAKAAEKTIPVGASKFGGGPDMPARSKWPTFKGEPLSFLGQFNLAELQASPVARELPAAGLLSVFALYDEDGDNDDLDFDKGRWRLLHFPAAAKLARREPHDELPDGSRFPSCRVTFTESITVPGPEVPWAPDLGDDPNDDLHDAYFDLHMDICLDDHLLGYPLTVYGDVLGKKTVRHLLTIGSNEHTGWEWGDDGALFFTLPAADLKKGTFDRVRMEMQCG